MKTKLSFTLSILFDILFLQPSNGYSQNCECTTPPYNNIIMDWEIKIDGSLTNKLDVAYDVIPIDADGDPSTDDGYVAIGTFFIPATPAHKNDAVVMRLDANGGVVWQNVY
ncbi:MAG: hypothetical protein LH473_10320, partial [Chitinophagales bacterium]|nr:hypothetical protein [Chitinophagales bacterium]